MDLVAKTKKYNGPNHLCVPRYTILLVMKSYGCWRMDLYAEIRLFSFLLEGKKFVYSLLANNQLMYVEPKTVREIGTKKLHSILNYNNTLYFMT